MTILQFQKQFPNDNVCLDYIFRQRYPSLKGYCRIRTRRCYSDPYGHQIYPLKGTIFEKSRTALPIWFYALYLFSQSRHGVSAAELQRQTGVTYKCAFRMAHLIRGLMKANRKKLSGIVEADEAYIGGKRRRVTGRGAKGKFPVFGIVERNGHVKATVIPDVNQNTLINQVRKHAKKSAQIITDDFSSYKKLPLYGYKHVTINHSEGCYAYSDGDLRVHTNTIEGFWRYLKAGIKGTYVFVSRQHAQKYVDEAAFVWNYREKSFEELLSRI